MSKLRKAARGAECNVRLSGVCNYNPETTVLAHIRRGHFGMGIKPIDLVGVYACSACHDEIDRRTRILPIEIVNDSLIDAMCRQLDQWHRDGMVRF